MSKYKIPEKRCENCRYFSQHYSKQGLKFGIVNCGHCLNKNVKNLRKRQLKICALWEDMAIQKEERKNNIKNAIIVMSESLNEITKILKDDIQIDY